MVVIVIGQHPQPFGLKYGEKAQHFRISHAQHESDGTERKLKK